MLKMIKKEILEKLVRDNSLHKLLASKFECSERRIEQWLYRESKERKMFSNVNNYHVIDIIAKYLHITVADLVTHSLVESKV